MHTQDTNCLVTTVYWIYKLFFFLQSFDDRLVLDILELVGDRSFLSALRGVIVPPSDSISSAMTEFFSTRFVNATVVHNITISLLSRGLD